MKNGGKIHKFQNEDPGLQIGATFGRRLKRRERQRPVNWGKGVLVFVRARYPQAVSGRGDGGKYPGSG